LKIIQIAQKNQSQDVNYLGLTVGDHSRQGREIMRYCGVHPKRSRGAEPSSGMGGASGAPDARSWAVSDPGCIPGEGLKRSSVARARRQLGFLAGVVVLCLKEPYLETL